MPDEFPSVTVIVPTRPGQSEIAAVEACRALDYPRERLEILVARGRQPAVQRNAALKSARGEIIYFLDDDSRPLPGKLRLGVAHFKRPEVKMVGGPNLCPPDAPFLEQLFAVVLGSRLAFGPSRARYTPVGPVRAASEKELILCNLLARRDELEKVGGFDEALYPNEENALMDEVQKRGGQLLYDPEFTVYRRPRPTLPAFVRMLITYGRGRAEQFRLHPGFGSAMNFVPPFFLLYLVGIPLVHLAGLVPLRLAIWPFVLYLLVLFAETAGSVFRAGLMKGLWACPLILATHLCYGAGFWRGLFTRIGEARARPSTEVTLERITL